MTNLSTAGPADIAEFFEAVAAGIVVFDVSNSHQFSLVCTNSIYRAMHDVDHEPEVGCLINDFLPRYVQKHYREQFRQCCDLEATVDHELPLEIAGVSHWYRVRMVPVFSEGENRERIIRIFATCVDITEQKQLQAELGVVNSRLEAIVDSTYDAIVSIDDHYNIKTFNQAAEEMFGYDRALVIGQPLEMLLPEAARADHNHHINSFRKSPVQSRPMEARAEVKGLRSDGSIFPAEVSIAKILVHCDIEFTAVVRDISTQIRLLEELHLRATTDLLTGLSNRRHLVEMMEAEIERCERYDHPMSLLLLDADDFKSINDNFGHGTGDLVLQAIADKMQGHARKLDMAARWGGEEFCILLPETSIANARTVAERLLEDLHTINRSIPELGDLVVSASIGVAVYRRGNDNVDQLVSRADEAMYAAKNSGKNKVCLAEAD
ncbi:MAG: sensory histidine kinase [Zetaproteobacteria bacterium CG_4_9_14_3_um_filter_53_7]|nr:MAG: sensory histidine kinase [Zetaproteobacteria bacterium CG_4_9_14_3_um_filter_53_7]